MEVLITQPGAEPVDLGALKTHLRIDGTDQDDQIEAYEIAARKLVEDITGRAMITQTWRASFDSFYAWPRYGAALLKPAIELARAPVIGVDSISYLDATGSRITLDPSGYEVDTDSVPARIVPSYVSGWPTWPSTLMSAMVPVPNSVQITYRAGYGGTGDDVEPALVMAIKLLVGNWYENREATVANGMVELPLGVAALIAPYRIYHRGRDH